MRESISGTARAIYKWAILLSKRIAIMVHRTPVKREEAFMSLRIRKIKFLLFSDREIYAGNVLLRLDKSQDYKPLHYNVSLAVCIAHGAIFAHLQ